MNGSSIAPFAWFFMLLSMGSVTVLVAYCFVRIMSLREEPDGGPVEGPGGSSDIDDS